MNYRSALDIILQEFYKICEIPHPSHHEECQDRRYNQHPYGLPIAFHAWILSVFVVHIVQILPLCRPCGACLASNPARYHYRVSLPINQEKELLFF